MKRSALSKPAYQPFIYCLAAAAACVLVFAFILYGEGYAAILPGAALGMTAAFLASAQQKPLAYDPVPLAVGLAMCASGVVLGKFVNVPALTSVCRQPLWNFAGGLLVTSSVQPMGKKDLRRTLVHVLPAALIALLLFTAPRMKFDMGFSLMFNIWSVVHGFILLAIAPVVLGLCIPVRKPERGGKLLTVLAVVLLAALAYLLTVQCFGLDLPFRDALNAFGKKQGIADVVRILLVFCGMTLRR